MFIKPIEFWQSILENCEEGQNMENVWKRFAKDYLSIVISELTFTAAIDYMMQSSRGCGKIFISRLVMLIFYLSITWKICFNLFYTLSPERVFTNNRWKMSYNVFKIFNLQKVKVSKEKVHKFWLNLRIVKLYLSQPTPYI